ncbi:MAG: hypothetical protein PUB98_08450, partial [Clostridiales bacterium]|nr:hypothetical protein [Clostridiales bacterium]
MKSRMMRVAAILFAGTLMFTAAYTNLTETDAGGTNETSVAEAGTRAGSSAVAWENLSAAESCKNRSAGAG